MRLLRYGWYVWIQLNGNSMLENCLVAFKWLRLQYNDFKRYIELSAIQITPAHIPITIIIICSFSRGPFKVNCFKMYLQLQRFSNALFAFAPVKMRSIKNSTMIDIIDLNFSPILRWNSLFNEIYYRLKNFIFHQNIIASTKKF